MKKAILAAVVLFLFALGGCSKAGNDDCQKAADNLTAKSVADCTEGDKKIECLGAKSAAAMMQADGKHKCEGRFTKKQTECLAGLAEVTPETIAGCE